MLRSVTKSMLKCTHGRTFNPLYNKIMGTAIANEETHGTSLKMLHKRERNMLIFFG